MEKKNRIYIIITGVVAITLIWLSQSNRNKMPKLESFLGRETEQNNTTDKKSVNALEGTLWPSDNETKGNLMLVGKNATVYIRTSRDFSDLVGKYIIASINGTLENFTLLNIEENLTRDGFIRTP